MKQNIFTLLVDMESLDWQLSKLKTKKISHVYYPGRYCIAVKNLSHVLKKKVLLYSACAERRAFISFFRQICILNVDDCCVACCHSIILFKESLPVGQLSCQVFVHA